MTNIKPNIKRLIPNLSGKERASLLLKSTFSESKLLTEEEERQIGLFESGEELDEYRRHIILATNNRLLLVMLYSDIFNEFRYKAASLSWLYTRITYERPLEIAKLLIDIMELPDEDEVTEGSEAEESEVPSSDFIDRISVLERDTDFEAKIERISFKSDLAALLKKSAEVLTTGLEELVSIREALRRLDADLGNPAYPKYFNQEWFDECLRQAKALQKKHNDFIFYLLKPGFNFFSSERPFKREMKDFNNYVIKTPSPREDLVKEYLDLIVKNPIE